MQRNLYSGLFTALVAQLPPYTVFQQWLQAVLIFLTIINFHLWVKWQQEN